MQIYILTETMHDTENNALITNTYGASDIKENLVKGLRNLVCSSGLCSPEEFESEFDGRTFRKTLSDGTRFVWQISADEWRGSLVEVVPDAKLFAKPE